MSGERNQKMVKESTPLSLSFLDIKRLATAVDETSQQLQRLSVEPVSHTAKIWGIKLRPVDGEVDPESRLAVTSSMEDGDTSVSIGIRNANGGRTFKLSGETGRWNESSFDQASKRTGAVERTHSSATLVRILDQAIVTKDALGELRGRADVDPLAIASTLEASLLRDSTSALPTSKAQFKTTTHYKAPFKEPQSGLVSFDPAPDVDGGTTPSTAEIAVTNFNGRSEHSLRVISPLLTLGGQAVTRSYFIQFEKSHGFDHVFEPQGRLSIEASRNTLSARELLAMVHEDQILNRPADTLDVGALAVLLRYSGEHFASRPSTTVETSTEERL